MCAHVCMHVCMRHKGTVNDCLAGFCAIVFFFPRIGGWDGAYICMCVLVQYVCVGACVSVLVLTECGFDSLIRGSGFLGCV